MKDEIKEILDLLNYNKEAILNRVCCIEDFISREQTIKLLDCITNLQEENRLLKMDKLEKQFPDLNAVKVEIDTYKSRNEKAIEYITSYEAISTIQGLDKIEQNKKLDERTMNVMVERYLKVHHKLLNILQGEDKDE